MARARWAHIFPLVVATAAFAVVLVVPRLDVGVLFLSPAIVLLASLFTGCYLGEKRLARLAAAIDPSGGGARAMRLACFRPRRCRLARAQRRTQPQGYA
ncbi:MAG TPA: hypothetical protein VF526_02660 [Solirubrobacteraceae bacterium]|jgi:hypothetical protein